MTLVESIVRHERRVLIAALVAVPLLCAAWIVPMARDMYGSMSGSSAWMMTTAWDARHTALLGAMWIVMMIGMMTPSAAPVLLMYASVMRRTEGTRAALRVYPMAAGYLLVWTLFSVAATLLQRILGARLLSPMMMVVNPWISAGLLALAAVYQLTPIKSVCLDSCRSPAGVVALHTRPDARGAFRLGVEQGANCVGCCWALMLLLFAGGVMNLWTIASLTIFVLIEKIAPFGRRTRQLSAAGLLGVALWVLAVR